MFVTMITTDWGSFKAPDDLPPMEKVLRDSWEEDGGQYEALEPIKPYRKDFYKYVTAQGDRLRDGLEPQTYGEWNGSARQ